MFEAIAHGAKSTAGADISREEAAKMAHEGVKGDDGSLKRTYPKGKKKSGQKAALQDRLKEARNG
jgi:hypothetical protein